MSKLVGLAYDENLINICADSEAALNWLTEFFEGSFALSSSGIGPTVRFRIDPERHASVVRDLARVRCDQVDCFTLDGEFTHAFSHAQGPTSYLLRDCRFDVVYCVSGPSSTVEVVADADHFQGRTAFMRVVREIVTSRLLQQNKLPVHGACVKLQDSGVLVVGEKEAGKTSLLLHLLQSEEVQFVTNDRAFVGEDQNKRFKVMGMPTFVKVRAGSLSLFSTLEHKLSASNFSREFSVAESRSRQRSSTDIGLPPSVTPIQLAHLVERSPCRETPLGTIVFPEVRPDLPGVERTVVDPAVAAERLLRSGLLLPSLPITPSIFGSVIDSKYEIGQDELYRLCLRLTESVQSVVLQYGKKAFLDNRIVSML